MVLSRIRSGRARASVALLPVALLLVPLVRAGAEEESTPPPPSERLSVSARGLASAPADEVEVELVVMGAAEDAREAEKKHRARLERVLRALGARKAKAEPEEKADKDEKPAKPDKPKKKAHDEDDEALPAPGVADENGLVLEVVEARYGMGLRARNASDEMDDGTGVRKEEPEFRVGSAVLVRLRHIGKTKAAALRHLVAVILDKATGAGAEVGGPHSRVRPTVHFRLADPQALEQKAVEAAIAKGRARATALAKLAGRELGKLTVVSQAEPTTRDEGTTFLSGSFDSFAQELRHNDNAIAEAVPSSSLVEVEVVVSLDFDLR